MAGPIAWRSWPRQWRKVHLAMYTATSDIHAVSERFRRAAGHSRSVEPCAPAPAGAGRATGFCATTEADPVLEDIDAASPRSALDLLARIQQHTAHIGVRTFNGTSTATPEQLNLFDALSLPKPA
jgi:hypothetical protein